MKWIQKLFFVISIIVLLAACSEFIVPAPEPTLARITKVSPNATHSVGITPSVTATVAETSSREFIIQEKCLEISTDITFLQTSSIGSVVLSQDLSTSVLYQKLASPFIYNINTGETVVIPKASSLEVSLDNSKLAYITDKSELIIVDSTNNVILKRPFADVKIINWAKDGLLVDVNNHGQSAFIDSFTGERKLLDDEIYPNLYQPDEKWVSYWYPVTIYSPDLTKVVYIGNDGTNSETYIVLWDVNAKTELVAVSRGAKLSIAPEMKPEWSSDSKQVIIQTFGGVAGKRERELISVHADGSVQTLLDLNRDIATMRYSLSPDQKKLAFWSPDPSSSQSENLRLFIFDIETGTAIDYCITSPILSDKPIWSPDSNSLVVELLMSDLENSDVVVVELIKGVAVKIAEDARPVGWLK